MADEPIVEEEVKEEVVADDAKVEVVAPPASTAAEIAAAVAAAIAPNNTRMTPEQQEAEWQRVENESGMTRQQIIFNDNARREANQRENLPMLERLGAADAKEELADRPELLAEVKEYMSRQNVNVRANPQAWKDAAFLTLGKHSKDKKVQTSTGKVLGGKEEKVNSGLSEGGRSSGGGGGKKKEYSDFEKHIINTTCGGDAEQYEKFRGKDSTKPREVPSDGTNKADLEFKRLTKGAKI